MHLKNEEPVTGKEKINALKKYEKDKIL